MQRSVSLALAGAIAATVLFAASVAGFGAASAGFSQLHHPVAALGASRVPHALAFNAAAFVVPGALSACVAQSLRGRMAGAPFLARLGAQLLTLASLAFAALGLLPLDSTDLLSGDSRLHAAAWTAWWLAFVAGAAAVAVGTRGGAHATRSAAVSACAALSLLFAIVLPGIVPVGLSQRLAFAAWFLAVLLAAPSGSAASWPGSWPTGRA